MTTILSHPGWKFSKFLHSKHMKNLIKLLCSDPEDEKTEERGRIPLCSSKWPPNGGPSASGHRQHDGDRNTPMWQPLSRPMQLLSM